MIISNLSKNSIFYASSIMLKYLGHISKLPPLLILDMGCGEGRNAFALAAMGHHVTAADFDQGRLRALQSASSQIIGINFSLVAMDFLFEDWPFRDECFDLIVSIHFPYYQALAYAHRYIKPGGHLYFDSVGGQGNNYLQLPEKSCIREALSNHFDFLRYEERPVGPKSANIVAVRLLAQRTA